MFEYRKTDYYLVDQNTGESTKLDFTNYVNAYTWYKEKKVNFKEKTYKNEIFDFKDNTINNYLRMEVVSDNYNKCLNYLKKIK